MDGQLCLFVCGDVMVGRGIDQALPHPGKPHLFEPYVRDARDYVRLAEAASGPIPRPVGCDYIWGDALEELDRARANVRIINLETSITAREDYWPDKGIHYRMNPQNIDCLTAARIDCCTLANNHTLDWSYGGLTETLATLDRAGIRHAGAGANAQEAESPAILDVQTVGKRLRGSWRGRLALAPPEEPAPTRCRRDARPGRSRQGDSAAAPPTQPIRASQPPPPDGPREARVLVFSFGSVTSGIPRAWAAAEDRPGVNLLADLSEETSRRTAAQVRRVKGPGDIAVASIHWGRNWGYHIPTAQIRFAHRLIEEGVDIVHGHSSHHVKGLEVYQGRPILYGCGDFLTDYEGITGHEAFRGDLAVMYFVKLDLSQGQLVEMRLVPMQVRRFRLNRALAADAQWLHQMLNRECAPFGTQVSLQGDNSLTVRLP
jgi:poly-gamma-glutamate capsule biosynthesis protein CapA/YwtB (metallophosphatase superfamily)